VLYATTTYFLVFPYGFRPGRSHNQALDALYRDCDEAIELGVLDLDMQRLVRWTFPRRLVKFVEHRVADRASCGSVQQKMAERRRAEDGNNDGRKEGTPGVAVLRPFGPVYFITIRTVGSKRGVKKRSTAMYRVRFSDDHPLVGFHKQKRRPISSDGT